MLLVVSVLLAVAVVVVAAMVLVVVVVVMVEVVEVSAVMVLLAVAVAVVAAMVPVVVVVDMLGKLKLAEGLLHFEKSGKHLFFQPAIPDWIVVNENSAVLLLNCDGSRSASELISDFNIPVNEAVNITKLFEEAHNRGLLDGVKDRERSVNKGVNNKLGAVYLKLTDQCNLRCKYCYAESGRKTEILELPTLRRILREVEEITKTAEIVLSGGEPLLHENALDFAEEVRDSGHDVQLLTNGVLITDDSIAQRISQTTKLVKISIDGSTEEVHSLTRGKGNFSQVNKAVDLLIKHNANVQVAMTVTKKNVHQLAEMSNVYGSRLTLQPLFKAGRGKSKSDWSLTGEEYYHAMDRVENIAPMGNVAKVLESLRGRGVKKCALGDREISISETGDVYPCQLLHDSQFLSGNIYNSSLSDIYNQSTVLNQIRSINVDTISKCSTCEIRLICAGGCRARDFYESGDLRTVGEFCEYEKLAFINGLLDYATFES